MDISEKIWILFKELTLKDRRTLVSKLYKATEELELKGKQAKNCPHCNSTSIQKYGTHNGEQRFKCSDCSKTFKETTGTALNRIRKKALFLKFQDAMINEDYAPVINMSKRFGISVPTAFAWRHKVLLSLPEISDNFEGESEIDDLWIRYSQKGRKGLDYSKKRGGTSHRGDNDYQVKILTTTNKAQTEMKVTNIGRLSKSDIQRTMGDKLSKKTILISDKHKSIGAYAEANKISHYSFKAKDHTNSEGKGVQLLNSIAERVDTLLNRRFKGVSTKYLQLYVNWFKFKENHKGQAREVDMQNEILSRKHTWDLFSNIEKVYEVFIHNHSKRTYRCPQAAKYKAQNWNQEVIRQYSFI
jgi:transposase-like protein